MMWIRTINGWMFLEVKYTSQGFPIINYGGTNE